MSKGSMLLGYAKGKVGDLVFSRVKGNQITRAYNGSPANPRTEAQQFQRTKLAGLVNFYRRGRVLLNHSFSNKKENQSSYNAFISRNIQMAAVHLTKEQAARGACIVGPYVVSDGVLAPIQINGAGEDAVTNLAVGNLSINDTTTTVGQLSRALIENNADWMEGDQLTYVSAVQNGGVDGGDPFVEFAYSEIDLNISDTTLLRSVMPEYALSIKSGKIAHGSYIADGGFCWIHSRKNANGALEVSRQELILTINSLWNVYTGDTQTAAATRSYNAVSESLLTPDGSRAGAGLEGLPVIASFKVGGTTIVNGMTGFPASYANEASVNFELNGSNLQLADELSVEEVVAVMWTPTGGAQMEFSPVDFTTKSATKVVWTAKATAAITKGNGGTLRIQFNNNDGGFVEQTYTIEADTSSGSGTGGNPL